MASLPNLSFRWNDSADIADAAAFAGAVIAKSPEYISHGEIQAGLSDDGETWAANLGELYAQDFARPEQSDMLVGRDEEGRVRAFLIVAWEETRRRRFAIIEDMAVGPELRSHGLGSQLLDLAAQRIREHDVEWVFLESGRGNRQAHAFFERAGFAMISHVFARRLD